MSRWLVHIEIHIEVHISEIVHILSKYTNKHEEMLYLNTRIGKVHDLSWEGKSMWFYQTVFYSAAEECFIQQWDRTKWERWWIKKMTLQFKDSGHQNSICILFNWVILNQFSLVHVLLPKLADVSDLPQDLPIFVHVR